MNEAPQSSSLVGSSWLAGIVVRGEGRGREIGFPTANLKLDNENDRPVDGVYAAWVRLAGDTEFYKGAIHVGPRPTFDDAKATVEVHLIHFPDSDLYGRHLSFKVAARLRDIEKFGSTKELAEALQRDCERAESRLATTQK